MVDEQTTPRVRWWLPVAVLVEGIVGLVCALMVLFGLGHLVQYPGYEFFETVERIGVATVVGLFATYALVLQLRQRGDFRWRPVLYGVALVIGVVIGCANVSFAVGLLSENADDLGNLVQVRSRRWGDLELAAGVAAIMYAVIALVTFAATWLASPFGAPLRRRLMRGMTGRA
jgi:uncharacterized membrane protein (Fun14 family)